jgi:hypothetical protein
VSRIPNTCAPTTNNHLPMHITLFQFGITWSVRTRANAPLRCNFLICPRIPTQIASLAWTIWDGTTVAGRSDTPKNVNWSWTRIISDSGPKHGLIYGDCFGWWMGFSRESDAHLNIYGHQQSTKPPKWDKKELVMRLSLAPLLPRTNWRNPA